MIATQVMVLPLLSTVFGVAMAGLIAAPNNGGSYHWTYGKTNLGDKVLGPPDWHIGFDDCGHDRQSPIDIDTSLVKSQTYSNPVKMTFDKPGGLVTGTLENTDHSPTLRIEDTDPGAQLTGGPLRGNIYTLANFHVHFGCQNDRGSEHTLNKKHFSGQLHMVFKGPGDALAVVALWIEVASPANQVFGNFANLIKFIIDVGNTHEVKASDNIRLMGLLPQNDNCNNNNNNNNNNGNSTGNGNSNNNNNNNAKSVILKCYYTYEGSLTTPPCYETVQWFVLKQELKVSNSQLEKLRKLKSDYGKHPNLMCDNARPVQPLNKRTVYSVTQN